MGHAGGIQFTFVFQIKAALVTGSSCDGCLRSRPRTPLCERTALKTAAQAAPSHRCPILDRLHHAGAPGDVARPSVEAFVASRRIQIAPRPRCESCSAIPSDAGSAAAAQVQRCASSRRTAVRALPMGPPAARATVVQTASVPPHQAAHRAAGGLARGIEADAAVMKLWLVSGIAAWPSASTALLTARQSSTDNRAVMAADMNTWGCALLLNRHTSPRPRRAAGDRGEHEKFRVVAAEGA